jgi:hypothetical protein
VLLDFAAPLFPKGKERGGAPDVLFRAVPAAKLRNIHLGGFISVSSGLVPPARLHLTYPESDMNGRRDT